MFAEDLDAFLNTGEHAVAGTYDGATEVAVILDQAYLEQLGISGVRDAAVGKASVFPAAAVGKTLAIAGVTYTIRGREPLDDGAFVLLALKV